MNEEWILSDKVSSEESVTEETTETVTAQGETQTAGQGGTTDVEAESTQQETESVEEVETQEETSETTEHDANGESSTEGVTGVETQPQGYYGGSYHSQWKACQNRNQEKAANRERNYETYELNRVKPEDKKKKASGGVKKLLTTVGLAIVFGVVAGSVMFGVNRFANNMWGEEEVKETTKIPTVQMPNNNESPSSKGEDKEFDSIDMEEMESIPGTGYSVATVAESCMPSVVSITNATVTFVQNYFGGVQEYTSESSGSGIIVGQNDVEIMIATNKHVVEGAETLTVAFCDNTVCTAQIKGTAENMDLAVIAVKLSDMPESALNVIRVVKMGNSDQLKIGEQVVAIGNALGYGQSVTSGWISALDRSVEDEDGNVVEHLIQTDAAINPGNSGGALLNMQGELIGINSAKTAATNVEGMGYAISITQAEPVLSELMNIVTRYKVDDDQASYIGVTCMAVDDLVTQMYGIPKGAFIKEVEAGGPGDKAGIRKGDVLIRLDGRVVAGSSELVEMLKYYAAGEVVEVVVARGELGEYKEITLTVTLGNRNNMKQQ